MRYRRDIGYSMDPSVIAIRVSHTGGIACELKIERKMKRIEAKEYRTEVP